MASPHSGHVEEPGVDSVLLKQPLLQHDADGVGEGGVLVTGLAVHLLSDINKEQKETG